MKFSEVDPLRADAVESALGVKLNDGVLFGLGGGEGFALDVASEVVVGASGVKLGAATCGCFVPSSGFANANEVLDLVGSVAGTVGAPKEKVGNAAFSLGAAVGTATAGKSSTRGELLGEESLPSSTNGIGGPTGLGD